MTSVARMIGFISSVVVRAFRPAVTQA